jgi:hypothetical protein
LVADEHDRELVRSLIEARFKRGTGELLVRASRPICGENWPINVPGSPASRQPVSWTLRQPEAARRVCDVAESVERHARELTVMARADFEFESQISTLAPSMLGLVERYNGGSTFTAADLRVMEQEFFKQFGRILPVSTRGDSAVHRALGSTTAGDSILPSAIATRGLVGAPPHRENFSFSPSGSAGMATGAHIHIGPGAPSRAAENQRKPNPSRNKQGFSEPLRPQTCFSSFNSGVPK